MSAEEKEPVRIRKYQLDELCEQQKEIFKKQEEILGKLSSKRKDTWDKLSSVTGVLNLVASLVIAAIGLYFTNTFKARDVHIAELGIGEKYASYLKGDNDYERRAALNALLSLENKDLAFYFAAINPSDGINEQLERTLNEMKEGSQKARLTDPLIYAYANRAYKRLWVDPKLSISDNDKVLALDSEENHRQKRGDFFLSSVYLNRGIANYELGETGKAATDLQKSIEIFPKTAFSWTDLAIKYEKDKKSAKSSELYSLTLQNVKDEEIKKSIQKKMEDAKKKDRSNFRNKRGTNFS
jgi:tetratricopeptide (TPR) repeat protein